MHTSRLHWEVLYMIEEIRLPKNIFAAEGCPSLVKEDHHYRWSETPILICRRHWDPPTFIHHDSNTANTVPTCVCLSGCSTHTLILGILDEKCHLSEGCHQFSLIGRKCTTANAANNCGHENQLALTWKRWMSKQRALSVASCSLERLWMRWHSFFSGLPLPELSGHASDVYRSNRGTRHTETKQTKRFSPNYQSKGERHREDNWILKDRLSAAIYFCLSRSISLIPIINSSPMVPAYIFLSSKPTGELSTLYAFPTLINV